MVAMVKRGRELQDGGAVPSPAGAVPSDNETAAAESLRALAAGNAWTVNQLQDRFWLTRAQSTKVRQQVLAGSNGHNTGSTP